jgi:acyl-CoA synthetase (AMP-forming)/AMP-acid ligase II
MIDVTDLEFTTPATTAPIERPPPTADRTVQIALTSGTTGRPKLAALSCELKQLTFEGFTGRLRVGPGDRMLPMSPITQGVGHMCLYALQAGATLVMSHAHRFDANAMLQLAERSGATVLGGVPTMFSRLLHDSRAATTNFAELRISISAGAPLDPAVAEAWERLTRRPVCSFYGAMDIGQLAVPTPEDPPVKRWTTVGRPHDSAEWRICSPNGTSVDAGQVGEICMRGPLVQQRYWGEDHGPFSDDEWAHFGDAGFVDAEGFLHVTGRIKDTIIRGGNNINPTEVEQVLREHPAIRDACVVGRPDADLGERAVAFLVAAPGARVGLTDVTGFLRERGLTQYKWPEFVVSLEALPIGATGKVDRSALRQLAADAPQQSQREGDAGGR